MNIDWQLLANIAAVITILCLLFWISRWLYKWVYKNPRELVRALEQLEKSNKNQIAIIAHQQIEMNVRDKMILDLIGKADTSIHQVNELSDDSTGMMAAVIENKHRISAVNKVLNSYAKHLLANGDAVQKQLEEQKEMLQRSFMQISQLLKHIYKKRQ